MERKHKRGIASGVFAELFLVTLGEWFSEILIRLRRIEAGGGRVYDVPAVQGGERHAPQEKRLEMLEALERRTPPVFLELAKRLNSVADPAMERYVGGLLRGIGGEELRRAARISPEEQEELRAWLLWTLEECGIPLTRFD